MKSLMVLSQTKSTLTSCLAFSRNDTGYGYEIMGITFQSDRIRLAIYKTKEHANMVMRMLKWHMDEDSFEMPEENDVEDLYEACVIIFCR